MATATGGESEKKPGTAADVDRTIDLRDPYVALFLAWLIPGAGHFYQRRWGKGGLFSICILGLFVIGMVMGQGRVVWASWRPGDERYPYICQLGAGLPALPALVNAMRMGGAPPRAPWFGGFEAPPLLYGQAVDRGWAESRVQAGDFDKDDFQWNGDTTLIYRPLAAGPNPRPDPYNETSDWNKRLGMYFELGTVYTVIAGLLNILAMYDAWGGPALGRRKLEPAPPESTPAAA